MRPALALLLVLGLLAGACSGAEDLSESSSEFEADAPDATAPAPEDPAPEDPAGEDPTGEDPAGEASTADDLRIVELEVDNSGEVVVDVASDEVSLLLVARGQGLDDEVFVDAIIAPDGTLVDAPLELQPSNVGDTAVLLPLFADVPEVRRGAHFACAVAYVDGPGEAGRLVVEGRMDGTVITELRGEGGFGYDVLFVADEHSEPERTSAELDPAEKDRVSHRGRALREIAPLVAARLDGSV